MAILRTLRLRRRLALLMVICFSVSSVEWLIPEVYDADADTTVSVHVCACTYGVCHCTHAHGGCLAKPATLAIAAVQVPLAAPAEVSAPASILAAPPIRPPIV